MTELKCWCLDTSPLVVLYKPYLIIPTLLNRSVFSKDGICAKVLWDISGKDGKTNTLSHSEGIQSGSVWTMISRRCCCHQRRQFSLITLANCLSCRDQPWSRWNGPCSHSQDQGWNLQMTSYQSRSSVAMWEITATLTLTVVMSIVAYSFVYLL